MITSYLFHVYIYMVFFAEDMLVPLKGHFSEQSRVLDRETTNGSSYCTKICSSCLYPKFGLLILE